MINSRYVYFEDIFQTNLFRLKCKNVALVNNFFRTMEVF